MSESLLACMDRLENSRIIPKLYGWKGPDLKEMLEEIDEIGLENLELRIIPGLKEDGTPDAWFWVVNTGPTKAERPGGTYNVAYTCPPVYPPGCEPICPPECKEKEED